MVAPALFTACAVLSSCSRDSTEHGPAMTTTPGPPIETKPATSPHFTRAAPLAHWRSTILPPPKSKRRDQKSRPLANPCSNLLDHIGLAPPTSPAAAATPVNQ